MAKTPRKLVHWALDTSLSDLGSPFSTASSSDADSTSSLQYINAQLVSHGFTYKPGLSLDGTSKEDADKVVKCLLAMLSQRIDDMSRTEELSTKIRTLSYDHERLQSMYRAATEKAANAEREASLHKSRLANVTRTLQTAEAAHKQTNLELQRTRTALQGVRTSHAAEIKKIEKEKERALDRWNKLADQQLKLGSVPSGIRFSNAEVVEASDVQLRGKGKGFLEVAAEQAQEARDALFDENRKLRGMLLSTVNEIQRLLHNAKSITAVEPLQEPPVITTVNLFPMSSIEAANSKFTSLLSGLRGAMETLAEPAVAASTVTPAAESKDKGMENGPTMKDKQEIVRLTGAVNTLRKQLQDSQRQTETYAAQVQELFDKLAAEERSAKAREPSVDLMTGPALDEERERLNKRSEELEEDRRKFTEAALKLGKEKATERIKLLEEKRAWQVDVMLSHLPPTPDPPPEADTESAVLPEPVIVVEPPRHSSPRKSAARPVHSPRKAVPVGGGKRRAVRRSMGGAASSGPLSPKGKSRVIPAFETEVIPPSPSFTGPPAFKTTLSTVPGPSQLQLPPAFVLPPPSPAAQLPPRETLLSATLIPSSTSDDAYIPNPPAATISKSCPDTGLSAGTVSTSEKTLTNAPAGSQEAAPAPASQELALPTTPGRRPFPLAKPLAQRMIHAYSPAKPSPLSRILMLANSPGSPPGPALKMPPLSEDESSPDVSPTPVDGAGGRNVPSTRAQLPGISLAAELGLPVEDEDENPLLDKKPKSKTYILDKARMKPSSSRSRAAVPEKENTKRSKAGVTSGKSLVGSRVITRDPTKASKLSAKTAIAPTAPSGPLPVRKAGPSRGGPRRVPIDSAEAAPVPRAWKG
ncbi:hypothetical protein NM688_g2497 [Phlebia brevispora]|uniref:Uncharacterized protein n=1 Tax=Phlebia brevispora TaxID=194682 RepID=A0ACC1T8M1_9APHY|nr:hypothetical protein NM688_g2497 [Phlebia brevispora]